MDAPRVEPPVTSLWAATAGPAPSLPHFEGEEDVDVAIIGGGYTGLAAAHRLIARGVRPAVLEANTVGWGASGRNGGVVSAKYRISYPEIASAHGVETAQRMHGLAYQAVDTVASLIDEYRIAGAGFTRCGNLRCAHTDRALVAIVEEAEWLRRELGDRNTQVIDRGRICEETGSTAFTGGVLTEGVGTLHPLNFAYGLAGGLVQRHGPVIYEHSPVLRLQCDDQSVVLDMPTGRIRARQVILASNAYSSMTRPTAWVKRRLIPFRSSIIATEPLPKTIDECLLTHMRSYGETRRMMRWFRKVGSRLVFGGRGAFGKEDSASAFRSLEKAMRALFPAISDIPVAYRWSGHVGMTLDGLPHVGRVNDQICFAAGYNGAGVALSTQLGLMAADYALGDRPDVALLDAARLRAVPLYPLREGGVRMVAGWYQFLDAIGR